MPDAPQFLRHLLVGADDFVEGIGDLAFQTRPVAGKTHGEVAVAHRLQAVEQRTHLGLGLAVVGVTPGGPAVGRSQRHADGLHVRAGLRGLLHANTL